MAMNFGINTSDMYQSSYGNNKPETSPHLGIYSDNNDRSTFQANFPVTQVVNTTNNKSFLSGNVPQNNLIPPLPLSLI